MREHNREGEGIRDEVGFHGRTGERVQPTPVLRVLIVEDIPSDVELILREVRRLDFRIVHEVAETRESFLEALDRLKPDIVLSDYSMPVFDGMTALRLLQETRPGIPFIVVTGSRNEEVAVECMKAGAADYLIKENLRRLGPAVIAALEKYRLKREKELAEEAVRRSRDELEKLVRERTRELEERNRKLAREIAEHRRTEEEKQRIEAQLIQSQKIEALGKFAGGIAHDLNNILYPIIINTEMLLEETDPGTSAHEALGQTLKAAHRQKDLVKKILSFSRQSEQRLKKLKLAPFLEETLTFVRSSLPTTIEMRQRISAPEDAVMGDPSQLQQVIVNLCRNAADALESQKGVIEVVLGTVCLNEDPARPGMKPGTYLELKVRDNGKGIPPEIMDRIFEPYFTTKGVGKGVGMGLSVVHGILKSHGGVVTVESSPGKGAQFTVYLPVAEGAEGREAADACPAQGRKKILLVDDEEIILSSMKRALERSSFSVAAARDGSEALALFEQEPDGFDLVITDLTMPGMNGLAVARKLMEIRPDLPVILCTGFSDIIDEEEAKAQSIRELILKPAGTAEIKEAVSRALGG
ncbi:MAG TPA: response regulator [Deltaproteobacteria bacterium]|nr:response regulator [Deltaproteobacteria bacterium]HOI07166.1 response regulator [Deltaproteobacteria bacterium]